MNEEKYPISIREAALLLGPVTAYRRNFTKICGGNANAGVFMSQFYFWKGKGKNKDGWIYKTGVDIEEETGLGRTGQTNARKCLKALHLMQEKKAGMPAKLHFLFDWDEVDRLLVLLSTGQNMKVYLEGMKRDYKSKLENEPTETRNTNKYYPSIAVFDKLYKPWKLATGKKVGIIEKVAWTVKEKGQLKNLVNYIWKSLSEQNKDEKVNPEKAANALEKLLEFYIALCVSGRWYADNFSPSRIYSNIQLIYEEANEHYSEFIVTGNVPKADKKASAQSAHKWTETDKEAIERTFAWGGGE